MGVRSQINEFKINLKTFQDVVLFTTTCNDYEEDIDIYYHSLPFDAKSLNANVNMIGSDVIVSIHTQDLKTLSKFATDMMLFSV